MSNVVVGRLGDLTLYRDALPVDALRAWMADHGGEAPAVVGTVALATGTWIYDIAPTEPCDVAALLEAL